MPSIRTAYSLPGPDIGTRPLFASSGRWSVKFSEISGYSQETEGKPLIVLKVGLVLPWICPADGNNGSNAEKNLPFCEDKRIVVYF